MRSIRWYQKSRVQTPHGNELNKTTLADSTASHSCRGARERLKIEVTVFDIGDEADKAVPGKRQSRSGGIFRVSDRKKIVEYSDLNTVAAIAATPRALSPRGGGYLLVTGHPRHRPFSIYQPGHRQSF